MIHKGVKNGSPGRGQSLHAVVEHEYPLPRSHEPKPLRRFHWSFPPVSHLLGVLFAKDGDARLRGDYKRVDGGAQGSVDVPGAVGKTDRQTEEQTTLRVNAE